MEFKTKLELLAHLEKNKEEKFADITMDDLNYGFKHIGHTSDVFSHELNEEEKSNSERTHVLETPEGWQVIAYETLDKDWYYICDATTECVKAYLIPFSA